MKKKIIEWLILILLIALSATWVHFDWTPHVLDNIRTVLEEYISTRITIEKGRFNWLARKAAFRHVVFESSDLTAWFERCTVELGWPDFADHRWPIRQIVLKKPFWRIAKENGTLSFFPDFFSGKTPDRGTWSFPIDKAVFKNFQVNFIDRDADPSMEFDFIGRRLVLVNDAEKEQIVLKGNFAEVLNPNAEVHMSFCKDYSNYGTGFSLLLAGNDIDFARLSPYQYPFSKLRIRRGRGSVYFDFTNRLGVLRGYFYIKINGLKMDAFEKSIFSTVLGLSSQSVLNLLKQNNDRLELDFYIYGTHSDPVIKMGNSSRNMLVKAPVSIAKNSIRLLGKTINFALLGIPGRIIESGRNGGGEETGED